jgi:hypothetical protein
MNSATSSSADYAMPSGRLGLKGPVAKPEPGTLPLRGDLAHIALAGTHLAAHYVIPEIRKLGSTGAPLRLNPRSDSETMHQLGGDAAVEVLDIAGDWAWITVGPQGPSGYVTLSELA